jgi:hypothetical protein
MHRVPFPTGLVMEQRGFTYGTVLCADAQDVQMHNDCISISPFKFVLICSGDTKASAWVYKSSSGMWGNIVSIATNDHVLGLKPEILIGSILVLVAY